MDQDIDCVVIGRNCGNVLERTFASLKSSQYTRGSLNIIFVDRGSSDTSATIATAQGAKVVTVKKSDNPRQAGWTAGSAPLVQFVEAGSVVSSDWFQIATKGMRPETVATYGARHELYPEASTWAKIIDMERNGVPGEQESFGAEALLRRSSFEAVTEEPSALSQTARKEGGKIVLVDTAMLRRDSHMRGWDDWWAYCYRQGYAFGSSHRSVTDMLDSEMTQRGGASLLLFILGIILSVWSGWWLLLCMAAIYILIHPRVFHVEAFQSQRHLALHDAALFAWHRSFAVVPQFLGALKARFS